jgi:NAD(P)-dependent dehydrogenase (short-subunit alcohol dehydrogenase family)
MSTHAPEEVRDLTAKRIVITGGTGGLGFEAAAVLAQWGGDVVLLGRSGEKGRQAIERLKAATPLARLSFVEIDLASMASVNAAADVCLRDGRPIDVLINNAGVMAVPRRELTVDGFERQLATNHLGHFLLTARLLPLLRAANHARVVNVSSLMHRVGRIQFDDLQSENGYNPNAAYGQSKLANLLFTFELQRLSDKRGWGLISLAAHPGGSQTDLIANGPGSDGFANRMSAWVVATLGQSAADGARPILYAAISSNAEASGYYGPDGLFEMRGPPRVAGVAKAAKDTETAHRLWAVSEEMTGAIWPIA